MLVRESNIASFVILQFGLSTKLWKSFSVFLIIDFIFPVFVLNQYAIVSIQLHRL